MTLAASLSRTSWRPLVTRAALLGMETLWVYAFMTWWVAAIAEGGNPSLLGVALVVFVSFAISRLLQLSDLSLGIVRVWGVMLSVLIFYAIVRVDFFGDWRLWDFSFADRIFLHTEEAARYNVGATFGIPLFWVFWLRGVMRGQQHTGFDEVAASFALGLLVIAFVLVFEPADVSGTVGIVPVPYVALGLMAIALAHAARADDEFNRTFAPTWIIAAGGAIAALSLIALLFLLLDYGGVADGIKAVALAVGWVLGKAFYIIAYPFLWLLEQTLTLIAWLIDKVWGGNPRDTLEPTGEAEQPEPQESDPQPLPAWLRMAARAFIGSTAVILILLSTALLFAKFRRRIGPDEVKESVYQEGRLAADLSGLLNNLLGRLRPNIHLGRERLDPARRLYFDVLEEAHHKGVDRRKGETPLELSPRLEQGFGTETPRGITKVFDDVRYGSQPVPEDEVSRLRREWESRAKEP